MNSFQDLMSSSSNPVSDVPKIWIRADYIRVYKHTESIYDFCYECRRVQAVVFTGHPGTGECVCLYLQDTLLIVDEGFTVYATSLCRKKTGTMDLHYIFVDDSVYKWHRIFTATNLRSSCGPCRL